MTLDEAWAEAVAALPDKPNMGLILTFNPRTGKSEAHAWHWDAPPGDYWPQVADTPVAALQALTAELQGSPGD